MAFLYKYSKLDHFHLDARKTFFLLNWSHQHSSLNLSILKYKRKSDS